MLFVNTGTGSLSRDFAVALSFASRQYSKVDQGHELHAAVKSRDLVAAIVLCRERI